jgi:hypothetical protein
LVIGPVSSVLSTENGGLASNTWVLPVSLSVNQTCEPSGVAAMLGQNGLACRTFPTIKGLDIRFVVTSLEILPRRLDAEAARPAGASSPRARTFLDAASSCPAAGCSSSWLELPDLAVVEF